MPDNVISVFVSFKTKSDTVKAQCIFTVLDENERQLPITETTEARNFSSDNVSWGYPNFVKKAELESHIKNDCFIIKCTLTAFKVSQVEPTARIIVLAGNIFAHKCILAERSPVFLAQFFGPMKEKSGTVIKIEEIKAPVFKSLLHFKYYDRIPEFEETKESKEEQDT